jgi:hypothetical protein
MFVAAALVGFLIGQVITVEGMYFHRLLHYSLLILFTALLALLPLMLTYGFLLIFGLERSPFVLLSIVLLIGQGALQFLHIFSEAVEHSAN